MFFFSDCCDTRRLQVDNDGSKTITIINSDFKSKTYVYTILLLEADLFPNMFCLPMITAVVVVGGGGGPVR